MKTATMRGSAAQPAVRLPAMDASRAAAYRRLAAVILRLDVASLSIDLRASRQTRVQLPAAA